MRHKDNHHDILNFILDLDNLIQVKNLASYKAKRVDGSLLRPRKKFELLENEGLIRKVPNLGEAHLTAEQLKKKPLDVNNRWWQVTRLGAREIGRESDYKRVREVKSVRDKEHESQIRDVCVAFKRLYPDYKFEFDLNAEIDGVKPDIAIKISNGIDTHHFVVEVERKDWGVRTYRETVLKYEKAKLKAKVLIVYSDRDFDQGHPRPQCYSDFIVAQRKEMLMRQFQCLLKASKDLPGYRYLFLPYPDYHRLNERVWYLPNGHQINLIS